MFVLYFLCNYVICIIIVLVCDLTVYFMIYYFYYKGWGVILKKLCCRLRAGQGSKCLLALTGL